MFSQCGNLFRELNVLQKFSGLEDVWNTFCILAKIHDVFDEFLQK